MKKGGMSCQPGCVNLETLTLNLKGILAVTEITMNKTDRENDHVDFSIEVWVKRSRALAEGRRTIHASAESIAQGLSSSSNRANTSIHMSICPLPQSQRSWSIAVRIAYQKLHQIYQTGFSYVNSGSVEAHRLQQYGHAIIADAFPLL